MAEQATAFIALGSNLHNPVAQVRAGFDALAHLPCSWPIRVSSLYRTAPVGDRDQPDFINAVVSVATVLSPEDLLRMLLEIENRHGRVRAPGRIGGPRTLDLDLLLYGDAVLATATLTLPHPRLHERAFVLHPLAEIAPTLVIPGRGAVGDLLQACHDQTVARLPRDALESDHARAHER